MDLSYGFANARIRAMRAQLLPPETYRELATVRSVAEMTTLLQETAYKEDLLEASKHAEGIRVLMEGLQANFSRTLHKVSRLCPRKAASLYAVATAEWDQQDAKTVVAHKMLGTEFSEKELYLASKTGRKLVSKLSKVAKLGEIRAILKSGGYSDAVGVLETQGAKEDDVQSALAALDFSLYSRFANAAKDPNTDSNTRALLTARLNLVNTLLVLRLKPFMAPEDIKQKLVVQPTKKVLALVDAKDLQSAISELDLDDETFKLYRATEALSVIELSLEKAFVKNALRRLRCSILSFGTVLGFLYLKSAEITQLRRMALGKYFDVEDEMKQHVYW